MSTPRQFGLFEAEPTPFRARLAERLARLAEQGIYVGTSSWKYEGWIGQVYTAERYQLRGRFSERLFRETCLAEYAETFPVVCGDFSFYQFPPPNYWERLFRTAPVPLRFAFKVPEEITVKTWPRHDRYGTKAGQQNENFLSAELLARMFADLLQPYRERVVALIFEFGAFGPQSYERGEDFVTELDKFLENLPEGFRHAVEIRNPEFLGPDYLGCLRRHGVAHVFNAWTRMPELGVQIRIPGIETADYTLTRALLKAGRAYAQAVKQFQPYARTQEENTGAREAMRDLIRRSKERGKEAYIFVNNRLEGNAPGTIEAVVGDE